MFVAISMLYRDLKRCLASINHVKVYFYLHLMPMGIHPKVRPFTTLWDEALSCYNTVFPITSDVYAPQLK